MEQFEIKEQFYLNSKPFKIMSGAIHYFRIVPEDWYHSLYNLKALGFNTVETYVPWNLHEAEHGKFSFEGILDIEKFLETAQQLGLYAIVRPSPYICAEWEFGGLPAWLLTKDLRIRSSDKKFMDYVAAYYDVLLPKLARHQLSQGGNILMFQVENEYGSYGEDKEYLRGLYALLRGRKIDSPFFTSDGTWAAALRAGSMLEEDVFVTGNFGSDPKKNFKEMKLFFEKYQKNWPLMCMEFWDGWFNRWGEEIVRRDSNELAREVGEVLEQGSINLYMFHGGTNFGFMNGCSARGRKDLPQVTSYDYDAPLNEQGNPTEKYDALQKMIQRKFPNIKQKNPLVKKTLAFEEIPLSNKVSLFAVLDQLTIPIQTKYPQTMEKLGQNTGYILYQTVIPKETDQEKLRIIDAGDRCQVYLDEQHIVTQYQSQIGEDIYIQQVNEWSKLSILIENMGRVNYGHKLLADTQQKGIRSGVMADLHFITNWQHFSLDFSQINELDFDKEWRPKQPAFYQYSFNLSETEDTFIDLQGFGKGIVIVNNNNIGRFWRIGPTLSLYIPKGYLNVGRNQLIIFETEGIYEEKINLVRQPMYKKMEADENNEYHCS